MSNSNDAGMVIGPIVVSLLLIFLLSHVQTTE
jgi:hypothetical protein